MERGRPDIAIPRTGLDHLLEGVAVVGLVVCAVLAGTAIKELPDTIATHFDASGQPDAWGSKWILLTLPASNALLYALLLFVGMISPRRYNFPWTITEANAARQYAWARRLVIVLKAESVWALTLLTWEVIGVARNGTSLSLVLLPMVIGVVTVTVVVYFVVAFRGR
jgi:uncharacterized membrane protein